jgi:hypothetical protein
LSLFKLLFVLPSFKASLVSIKHSCSKDLFEFGSISDNVLLCDENNDFDGISQTITKPTNANIEPNKNGGPGRKR